MVSRKYYLIAVRSVVRLLKKEGFTTKMARIVKPLTTKEIKEARPKDKEYRLYDGGGLMLCVRPSGKKVWRLNYTNENNKRTTTTIGDFEFVSLTEARKKRQEIRQLIKQGEFNKKEDELPFGKVFFEWLKKWRPRIVQSSYDRYKNIVTKYCFPVLENIPISKVTPRDIAKSLEEMDERMIIETLLKAKSAIKQTFDYAVAKGLCDSNPALLVTNNQFNQQKKKNMRHLRPNEVYKIMQFLESGTGTVITKSAIEFTLRTLGRTQQIIKATWDEIDYEKRVWIPDIENMKTKQYHYVPITDRMIEILKTLEQFKFNEYLFPSSDLKSHISNGTMLTAVNRAGINTTIHGLRHLGSTILNESLLFNKDVIEASLAHKETDEIRATYNKAQYINQRKIMLQWWSDFLDKCDTKENNEKALEEAGISLI